MRAFAIGVVAFVVVGFAVVVGVTQLFDSGSANRQTDKSVNVLLNQLDKVQGKRIAIDGDVKTRVAPWAVLLGSSDSGQVGLLVVASKSLPASIRQDAHVQATGVAARFSLAAFRKAHPDFTTKELERSPIRDLQGKPALLSARVTVAPVD